MKKFTLSLAALLLAGSSAFAHLNTVTDGGFEIGDLKTSAQYQAGPNAITDWFWFKNSSRTAAGTTIEQTIEAAREGKKAIKMTIPAQSILNRYDLYLGQKYHRAAEYKTTKFRATFFAKTSANIKLNIFYNDGTTTTSGTEVSLTKGDGDWKSYTVELPSNTLNFDANVEIRIGAAVQTTTEEAIVYIDDVYIADYASNSKLYMDLSKNQLNSGLYNPGSAAAYGYSGLFGPSHANVNSELDNSDCIEGDASLKLTKAGFGFETYTGIKVVDESNARLRVTFWAKGNVDNEPLICFCKNIGKDPNTTYSFLLSTAWQKYSYIVNYGIKEVTPIKDGQRIRFEITNANTKIDYVNIDTIFAANYSVPVVTNIPESMDLNPSTEGTISPKVDALDGVGFFYTCLDNDLVITRDGQYGVKLSSSVEKNYTLSVKYTDNITTVLSTVAVKVGNPSNLNNPLVDGRFTIDGSKLIVKADQAEVTINQVNGMVNPHKVVGEKTITLQKGINIITIKEADQQPVTVKVGI